MSSLLQPAGDSKLDGYEPKVAFFFPGQGAQTVGMAKDLAAEVPAAKELFDRASEILGYDLLEVCVEGPKEKLNSTAVSQPAIYVASLAAVEKLKQEMGEVRVTTRLRVGGRLTVSALLWAKHRLGTSFEPYPGECCSVKTASGCMRMTVAWANCTCNVLVLTCNVIVLTCGGCPFVW